MTIDFYLDSEEGDVVELFDKASDLPTVYIIVEPWTPVHRHLTHTLQRSVLVTDAGWAYSLVTIWCRDSTNHSSPMKLQAMSTSPL